MEVLIDGVPYVPRASIQKVTDKRLLDALGALMEIQYFNQKHRNCGIAFNALNALAPELAALCADNPKAAYDRVHKMAEEMTAEQPTEQTPAAFDRTQIEKYLPATVSDLKHHTEQYRREVSNENIRRDLYAAVIRSLCDDDTFKHNQSFSSSGGEGCFIRGYVRDVWDYLGNAYDLIHGIDFLTQYAEVIQTNIDEAVLP